MLGTQWQLRPLLDPALQGPTVTSRHLESLAKARGSSDDPKEQCWGGEVLSATGAGSGHLAQSVGLGGLPGGRKC